MGSNSSSTLGTIRARAVSLLSAPDSVMASGGTAAFQVVVAVGAAVAARLVQAIGRLICPGGNRKIRQGVARRRSRRRLPRQPTMRRRSSHPLTSLSLKAPGRVADSSAVAAVAFVEREHQERGGCPIRNGVHLLHRGRRRPVRLRIGSPRPMELPHGSRARRAKSSYGRSQRLCLSDRGARADAARIRYVDDCRIATPLSNFTASGGRNRASRER